MDMELNKLTPRQALIYDALNGLAYPDDKQVVELQVLKTYDLDGYVEVELRNWRARTDG